MSTTITSIERLPNLIAEFKQEQIHSDQQIQSIAEVIHTSIPHSVESLKPSRQVVREELYKYEDLKEFSKKVSEFLEEVNQTLIDREEALNQLCFGLSQIEGNIGIGDIFPSFQNYYLLRAIEKEKTGLFEEIESEPSTSSSENSYTDDPFIDIWACSEDESTVSLDPTYAKHIQNAIDDIDHPPVKICKTAV